MRNINGYVISENELQIMIAALPAIEAVPVEQDECWPGDGPAHDYACSLTDHTASAAAVAATADLYWDFESWSSTHAWLLGVIEKAKK